jgi:hypothetical protein
MRAAAVRFSRPDAAHTVADRVTELAGRQVGWRGPRVVA